jgi:hypothetical protein
LFGWQSIPDTFKRAVPGDSAVRNTAEILGIARRPTLYRMLAKNEALEKNEAQHKNAE